jgi:hypothetical protein
MMKDILRNGPISVEFQANRVFMMYSEGIMSEKGIQSVKDKASQLIEDKYQEQLKELA